MSTTTSIVDARWTEVQQLIGRHNESAKVKVDFEAFRTSLQEGQQAFTIESLRALKHEEISGSGVPTTLARAIAEIFRRKDAVAGSVPTELGMSYRSMLGLRYLQYQDPIVLMKNFNPDMPESPVGQQIRRRAKGRPTLVFNADGTLNAEGSALILLELTRDEPARTRFRLGDRTVRVYPVGQGPNQFRLIHPLDGTMLRLDGTGVDDDMPWGILSEDTRATIIIAVQITKELSPDELRKSPMVLAQFFSTVKTSELEALSQMAPKAFLLFEERKAIGSLPPLKQVWNGNGNSKARKVGKGDPAAVL